MGGAAPPRTLSLSHDLQWRLTDDPARAATLRLAQYRSKALDPEGSVELTPDDLPHIRSWLRKVLFAAEWPDRFEFAGAGILQMIPRPRPELYLERLSPPRRVFGPVVAIPDDDPAQPGVHQRLCLYEVDLRAIIDWLTAWSVELHGVNDGDWLVADRLQSRAPEAAGADEDWDVVGATLETTEPLSITEDSRSPAFPEAEPPRRDEEEEVAGEFPGGIMPVTRAIEPERDLRDYLDPSRGAPLSSRINPDRTFTVEELREMVEDARQKERDRIMNPVLIILYVFGLPLFAIWLWELAKRAVRSFF